MLEEPRPEDIGGHFGEDASLLLVLLAVGIVIIFSCAIPASNAGVAGVTYNVGEKEWNQYTLHYRCMYVGYVE